MEPNQQNITRDIEIKNKLTVTRGEGGGDNGGRKGKGHQGTCIMDTWTKPKGCSCLLYTSDAADDIGQV